ncbi:MAG: BCCT family transporter [Myxococcota bacterium]
MRKIQTTICPPVFITSAGLLIAFISFGVFQTETAASVLPWILDTVSTSFGWLYVVAVASFILFSLYLLLSPYGSIRLGDDHERPEFSMLTWFSMLFSAGMGIGLVFYGVAEPMLHYAEPPLGEGGTAAAAEAALPLSMFHWGIHAWAIYVLMALSIAYFAYRRKLPLALRSCFYGLLGDRIYGWPGHLIDICAVFGTLFGLATSLGLGAMQVSAGLEYLFGVPHTTSTQLVLIAVITVCAVISLVTGVHNGIRRLSELNMILAALLMMFVFLTGPTLFLVNAAFENLGGYATTILQRTFKIGIIRPDEADWIRSWTLFYWGWWIAWSPFVGMFVARISRGRTIREFILGVLLAPTAVTLVWFTVFGDTAIYLERFGGGGIADAVSADVSTAIYVMLERLPLSGVTSFLAAGVVAVFFVTSSDSASFVVDMLTSGGHPNPPVWQRIFWATAEGACAGVLLYAGGREALTALQAAVISIGLPFCVVLLAMCVSLWLALRSDLQTGLSRQSEGRHGPRAAETDRQSGDRGQSEDRARSPAPRALP